MNKSVRKISYLIVFILTISLLTITSFANTSMKQDDLDDLESELSSMITNELQVFIAENNIDNVIIDDSTFEIDPNKISIHNDNYDDIKDGVTEYLEDFKDFLLNLEVEVKEEGSQVSSINPNVIDNGTYYTASVWGGVPALGPFIFIRQDFSADVRLTWGWIVENVRLLGRSYEDGWALAEWDPIRSWYEYPAAHDRHLNVYMKGTIRYPVDVGNLSHTATFLDRMIAENGTLVDRLD